VKFFLFSCFQLIAFWKLPVDAPWLPLTDKLDIPENTRYRTADICAILGISPDLFRWRVLSGKYAEVKKDGRGRIFTLEGIDKLTQIRTELDQQRADVAKKR